jgi:hypothetical protein
MAQFHSQGHALAKGATLSNSDFQIHYSSVDGGFAIAFGETGLPGKNMSH